MAVKVTIELPSPFRVVEVADSVRLSSPAGSKITVVVPDLLPLVAVIVTVFVTAVVVVEDLLVRIIEACPLESVVAVIEGSVARLVSDRVMVTVCPLKAFPP